MIQLPSTGVHLLVIINSFKITKIKNFNQNRKFVTEKP